MIDKRISWWGIALALVMVSGIIFLVTGYDAGLPLYESKDERRNLDEIYVLRNLVDDDLWKPGYPPGMLYVNYGAQLLVEQNTGESAYDRPCDVIYTVRSIGIVTNLMTLILTAFLARKLGGNRAGIVAALAWLIAPLVLAQNQFGFPQVYEGVFFVLATYLGVLAVEREQARWALASTFAGLGAILFKYTLFPILGAGVGAALWLLLRRDDRKRWAGVLGMQFVLIALTAVALMTLGGAGSLADSGHAETTFFLGGGIRELFDMEKVIRFVGDAGEQIGLSLGVLLLVLVVGTLAYWSTAATWQRLGWIAVVGLGLSHSLFMVTYVQADNVDRNLLTASSLLAVGVSVAVFAMGRWLGRRTQRPLVGVVGVAGFLAVWLIPQLVGGWEWIHYRDLPVTYGAMVKWVNQYIPEETLIVNDERPFTREWSCDTYITTPHMRGVVTKYPLEEWLAQGIYYAQLSQVQIDNLQNTARGQAYLDQMTELVSFPPEGEEDQWRTWRRGNTARVAVYQLWSVDPMVETETVFGDQIRLLGYDLETAHTEAGDTLTLRFYWQPLQPLTADYNVFVHLIAKDTSDLLAQSDGSPGRSDLRPTSTWQDTDETFLSREFVIQLPDALEETRAYLRVGLYDWRTGERLLTDAGEETMEIPIPVDTDSAQ